MHCKLYGEWDIKTGKLLSDSLVNHFFKALSLCLSVSLFVSLPHWVRKTKRKFVNFSPTVADKKNYRQFGRGLPHVNVWNFKLYIAPINPNHRRLKAGSLKFRLNSLKLIIIRIECFGWQSIVFSSSFNRLPQTG